MTPKEVGAKIAELCREGKNLEAVDAYYAPGVVSEEAMEGGGMPRVMEGIDAIRGKNAWWLENHEIHEKEITGPFPNVDGFALVMKYEVTPKVGPGAGQRMALEEVAVYRVEDGKITHEKFFYSMEAS